MKKKLKGQKRSKTPLALIWHPLIGDPMVGYELRIQVTFTLYEQRRRPLNNGCQIPRNKNGECLLVFVPTLEDFPQAIWHSPNLNSMSPPGLQLSFRRYFFLPMHSTLEQRPCQTIAPGERPDFAGFAEAASERSIRRMYPNRTKIESGPEKAFGFDSFVAVRYAVKKELMSNISEAELRRIIEGIREDRDTIIKHNPIGSEDETLLWMLFGCLLSYLSVSESETPCFPGRPDANAYREAMLFVLRGRYEGEADPAELIDSLLK